MTLDRRSFLKLVGAGAGAAGLPMIGRAAELMPKGAKRVVVVGGGYGGTIAAKYIRMMDKSIEVVMIERNDHFISCPFSNLYIGGILKDLSPLTIKYDKLAANHGIKVVQPKSRPSTRRPRWSPPARAPSATTAWCSRPASISVSKT